MTIELTGTYIFTDPDIADPLVFKAYEYAKTAHGSQQRRYTYEPYIVHPLHVAEIVSGVPHTRYMLAAALLHDVVEDTPVTSADIECEFGVDVAVLVQALTNVSKPGDGNRQVRKALDLEHTRRAPPAAKTIKLADILSNVPSIIEHDSGFAATYVREKATALAILTEGDPTLHARAVAVIHTYLRT